MNLDRTLAIMLIPIFILSACSKNHPKEKGPVIAKVGNEYLYLYDMITPGDSLKFSAKGASFKKKRTEKFIMKHLYTKQGYSDGVHKNESIKEQVSNHLNKSMVSIVYKKAVLDKFANEKTLRDLYERLHKQVSARHLLISYDGAESPSKEVIRSKSDALQLIEEIKGRIASTDDFKSLADELSEDPTSTDGGDIGFFEWGQMEDSFQEAAFSLTVGSISEPVETSYGYHLILIDSIRTVSFDSFASMEKELNSRLYNIHRDEIIQAAEDFIRSLNTEAGTVLYHDRIEILSKLMFEYVQNNSSNKTRKKPVVFLEESKSIGSLATYDGRDLTTQLLMDLLKEPKTGWTIASLADTSMIKNIFVSEINKDLITKYGFSHNFDKDESVIKDLKVRERNLVWQEIRKLKIEDSIDDSEENLFKYYSEYKDNYVSKRISDILEILVSEKRLADSLYALIMNGSDMTSLALEFSERRAAKKNNGIIKGITSTRLGPIGKRVAKMNIGDTSKPVKVGKKWSIFKIVSTVPPDYIPFSEAKGRLVIDFKRDERKRFIEEFDEYLINKYKPHYYLENINAEVASSEIEQ